MSDLNIYLAGLRGEVSEAASGGEAFDTLHQKLIKYARAHRSKVKSSQNLNLVHILPSPLKSDPLEMQKKYREAIKYFAPAINKAGLTKDYETNGEKVWSAGIDSPLLVIRIQPHGKDSRQSKLEIQLFHKHPRWA